jgi:biofilm PGA synthesis lipoprotein PgaB
VLKYIERLQESGKWMGGNLRKIIRFMTFFLAFLLFSNDSLYAASVRQFSNYQNAVAVLVYHHIDPNESGITISPKRFKEHMDALTDHGLHVISLQEFENFIKYNTPIPPNAVLITFDDGYESVYKYAFPILIDHGYTATTFIIVKDSENPNENPRLPFLNFDEMREMQQKGMTFQSHTYNQHYQDNLLTGPIYSYATQDMETDQEYQKRVTSDLLLAKQRLEKELGQKQNMLAFPHGDYNQKLVDMGRTVGIDLFFTGDYGLCTSGNDLINRIQAGVPYVDGSDLLRIIGGAVKNQKPKRSFSFLPPKLVVNGIELENEDEAITSNGLALMPLRQMTKVLDASVRWDAVSESIVVTKDKITVSLHVGSNQAEVNGKTESLEVPVQLDHNHVMVPIRWITEVLGGKIEWNKTDNTINITKVGP